MLWYDVLPIQPQGVALHDVAVGFQRQEVQRHMDNLFRLFHHLAVCDPEGGFGNSHGKIVDLNAVELADGDLDGVIQIQHDLPLVKQGNYFILQTTQGQIGFRQEVAASTGRVKNFYV